MDSGGDLLLGDGLLLNSLHVRHTSIYGWEQVGRIETPERRLQQSPLVVSSHQAIPDP